MAGFFENRRQAKEIEREVKFKQGLSRVRNYVQKCHQAQKKYWELGKRSLKLGDKQQFENVAKAYLRTGEMITRWERFLVAMETVSLQRDQVKVTGEFAKSMGALSNSMMAGASPQDITKVQMGLERALTKAHTLDETLAAVMDATSDTIFLSEGLSEESLQQVETAMKGEAEHEEGETLDDRISAGLRRIEEEMRKESK
ncbi:MAG: Snf7 family protein [Chloroflexota bacterium]|nr:Snf7 family protein [Chloroflexota bacterium]